MVRYITWVIRSAFCKHEWKYEEDPVYRSGGGRENTSVSITCQKCQWHMSYRKWK